MMLVDYSEYIVLGIGVVIALLGWALKKEHQRIENVEVTLAGVADKLASALSEIGKNETRDSEWRQCVEENHKRFTTVDEQRREDARTIYDKIQKLETRLLEKIHKGMK